MIRRSLAVGLFIAVGLMPGVASAGTFVWSSNTDGLWTDTTKWTYVPGSGPSGAGYPTNPGDVALLGDETTIFSANRTITIPNDVHITVGSIGMKSNVAFTILAGGANSRIDFENSNGLTGTFISKERATTGNDEIAVPIRLLGRLRVTVTSSTNHITLSGVIGEAGGSRALTKAGPGALYLRSLGNLFTGATTVEEGVLALDGATPAILGNITVGNGNAADGTARLFVKRPEQIADFANVQVNADSDLLVEAEERIAGLTVNGGSVLVTGNGPFGPGILTLSSLTMAGGVVDTSGIGKLRLEGDLTATSNAQGPAIVRRADNNSTGTLDLVGAAHVFAVSQGPSAVRDLDFSLPLVETGSAGLTKDGAGRMRFFGEVSNKYTGVTVVRQGRLELAKSPSTVSVPGSLQIGAGAGPVVVELSEAHNINQNATVSVSDASTFILNGDQVLGGLGVGSGSLVQIGATKEIGARASNLTIAGGRIVVVKASSTFHAETSIVATSTAGRPATIEGPGRFAMVGAIPMFVLDGPEAIDLLIAAQWSASADDGRITKRDPGVAQFGDGGDFSSGLTLSAGTVFINGSHRINPVSLEGGVLGGTGPVAKVTGVNGRIAPGVGPGPKPGRLRSADVALSAATTLAMDLTGPTPGVSYDQLVVTGTVRLDNTRLDLAAAATLPPIPTIILIDNDGADAVVGSFAGLAEGATVQAGGRTFNISYRGGDGNDVVLTDPNAALTYYLAEGSTGQFFDDDVLIANPNTAEAPVTLTFLREGGQTVVAHRTVPAQSRLTVHVEEIPGLESAAASVEVKSDQRLPLVVERSMFWDASYYSGHTANAVAQPETRWIFAEGFQGFFDTYILIANANAEATTATLTFLRENDTPFVTTVPVGAFSRKTVYAGDYPEVVGRAFGIVVEATRPVIAERAMYFGSTPERLWAGGHANTGIVAPSTSWFHAEGATGTFFNTFILLSNPNTTPADVTLRFLLSTGEVITRQKTITSQGRVTINPATEGDARLTDAAVSTVVESNIPIVSERSMYWAAETTPFGEGHNSSGVVSTATRWGLAEGRVGGPHAFDTYILLANPGTQPADITVTYLREGGAPIVRTYNVPRTSRFNIDVKTEVPELQESSFGARIESTNGVPIAVERSMYWNAAGAFWAGGTNALGTPLP